MRMLRLPAVLALPLLALAGNAGAVPIEAYGGWLDATFQVFDSTLTEVNGTPTRVLTVRREFVLGVDYFPAVPLAYTQNGLSYEGCLKRNNQFFPECSGDAVPRTTTFDPGQGAFPPGQFGDPATQTPLGLGCTALNNPFTNDPVLIVARGSCSFEDKWAFAENGGWGGVLVAEAPGAPVGAVGFGPGAPTFTTPMARITADVAAEIRRGTRFSDLPPEIVGIPLIYLHVSWSLTRPPEPVPEPSSLALLAIGAAGLAAVRRRRR